MGTVNKVAAQLQVGDIYTCQGGRAVVVHTVDRGAGGLLLYTAMLGRQPLPVMTPPVGVTPWDATFCVEVPDAAPLTPAQEHAEELAEVLAYFLPQIERQVSQDLSDGGVGMGEDLRLSQKARALLDKVPPPNPPTLAEALALLSALRDDGGLIGPHTQEVVRVTDRAKKAGLL